MPFTDPKNLNEIRDPNCNTFPYVAKSLPLLSASSPKQALLQVGARIGNGNHRHPCDRLHRHTICNGYLVFSKSNKSFFSFAKPVIILLLLQSWILLITR